MSVSSVKNLNGNEFSAVQDTSLTEFVQTNSASWSGDNNIYYTNEGNYGLDLNSAYEAGKRIVVKMNDGSLLPVYKSGYYFRGCYVLGAGTENLSIQQYSINWYDGYTSKSTVTNPGVADWNCTNSASMSYIRNKPYIPDMSTVVQYDASSLYFPESNFKVDTSGNVYKITREGEETQVTGKGYINASEISFVLNGTFEPGTYEFRMPDHYLTLTNPDGGTPLTVINGVAKWVNTSEKTFNWKYLSPGPFGEPFLDSSNGSVWLVPNDVDLKYQLECDMSAYAYTSAVDNKLDTSSFSDVSSTFLTAHQDISNLMPKSESANFYPMTGNPSGFINELPDEEEVEFEEINLSSFATSSQVDYLSGAINYVSANAGDDVEVNNYVYTNSASINDTVSSYQTNSASYITELPDEEEVEFEELDLSNYVLASALDNKQNLLTDITDVQVVQSLPVSPVSSVLYLIPEV